MTLPYGRTHCRHGHLLTPKTAYVPTNRRQGVTCRVCRAQAAAAARRRKDRAA